MFATWSPEPGEDSTNPAWASSARLREEEGQAGYDLQGVDATARGRQEYGRIHSLELDALAAARNGSITTQVRDQLIAESRLMRKRVKER
jgi:hypothetical protein